MSKYFITWDGINVCPPEDNLYFTNLREALDAYDALTNETCRFKALYIDEPSKYCNVTKLESINYVDAESRYEGERFAYTVYYDPDQQLYYGNIHHHNSSQRLYVSDPDEDLFETKSLESMRKIFEAIDTEPYVYIVTSEYLFYGKICLSLADAQNYLANEIEAMGDKGKIYCPPEDSNTCNK